MKNKILNELQVDITFFVPCFNEEKNITKTLDVIISSISKTSLTYEVLVVDDKSQDSTKEVVVDYISRLNSKLIFLIENKINMGLGRNYVDSSFIANGKYFMLVNGDNAEPEETISRLISRVGEADMVIPYFGANDSRSFIRVYTSKTFYFIKKFIS